MEHLTDLIAKFRLGRFRSANSTCNVIFLQPATCGLSHAECKPLDFFHMNDFAALIGSAAQTGSMRLFGLMTLGAEDNHGRRQFYLRTPFVPSGF